MFAVDTNVLLRLILDDDEAQHRDAGKLFAGSKVFIPDTVFLEAAWVLRAVYELTADEICTFFRRVCGLPNVAVSDARRLAKIIDWHQAGLDFADAFHLALSDKRGDMKSFDQGFVRRAKKITNHRVERP